MAEVFLSLLCALGAIGAGCEDPPPQAASPSTAELRDKRQAFLRDRAAKYGAHHAQRVRLVAEDMAKLDPRSTRSEASREAKKLLDEIVPRETEDRGPR